MKDMDRVVEMTNIAAALRGEAITDKVQLNGFAHAIEKFAKLVLDRDAGPTRDVAAENLNLKTSLSSMEERAKFAEGQIDRHKAAFLACRDQISVLQNQLKILKKQNPEVESKKVE